MAGAVTSTRRARDGARLGGKRRGGGWLKDAKPTLKIQRRLLGSRAGGLESLSRRLRGPFFGEDKETVVLRVQEEFSEACFEGVDGAFALGTTALCPVWPPCQKHARARPAHQQRPF